MMNFSAFLLLSLSALQLLTCVPIAKSIGTMVYCPYINIKVKGEKEMTSIFCETRTILKISEEREGTEREEKRRRGKRREGKERGGKRRK